MVLPIHTSARQSGSGGDPAQLAGSERAGYTDQGFPAAGVGQGLAGVQSIPRGLGAAGVVQFAVADVEADRQVLRFLGSRPIRDLAPAAHVKARTKSVAADTALVPSDQETMCVRKTICSVVHYNGTQQGGTVVHHYSQSARAGASRLLTGQTVRDQRQHVDTRLRRQPRCRHSPLPGDGGRYCETRVGPGGAAGNDDIASAGPSSKK